MKTIEFKKEETKAALSLINSFRQREKELREVVEIEAKRRREEEGRSFPDKWVVKSWMMEAELLSSAIDQLETDIENQSFDI